MCYIVSEVISALNSVGKTGCTNGEKQMDCWLGVGKCAHIPDANYILPKCMYCHKGMICMVLNKHETTVSMQAWFQHTPMSKAQCMHPQATKTLGCSDGLAFSGTGWCRNGWTGVEPHTHGNSQSVDAPSSIWIFKALGGFSSPTLTQHWVMQWALAASSAWPCVTLRSCSCMGTASIKGPPNFIMLYKFLV